MHKRGDYISDIFLCKPDRAAALRSAKLLVTKEDLMVDYQDADPALFVHYFFQLPIVQACPELEDVIGITQSSNWSSYYQMAAEFIMAQDHSKPLEERYIRLCRAEKWIEENFKGNMPFAVILSFVRIWSACGLGILITNALKAISDGGAGIALTIEQPFLPLSDKWEKISTQTGGLFVWLANMMAETLEKWQSLSSLYSSGGTLSAYHLARQSGYLSMSLERRAALVSLTGEHALFPDPVFIAGPLQRNQAIWNEIAGKLGRGECYVKSLNMGYDLDEI